jgi:uncharacterized Tic20 family protein
MEDVKKTPPSNTPAQSLRTGTKVLDITAGSIVKTARKLPSFMLDEAEHIVKTGHNFRFEKRFLRNGLIHLCYIAQFFVPFSHIIIPFLLWKSRGQDRSDALCDDAMRVCNFNITYTIYAIALALLTISVGLLTYPFILNLAGADIKSQERPWMIIIPTVLAPSMALYMFYWFLLSVRAALARSQGRPFVYPGSHSFLTFQEAQKGSIY